MIRCVNICDHGSDLISCCFMLFQWFFYAWFSQYLCLVFLSVCLRCSELLLFHDWCHFSKTRHKTNKPTSKIFFLDLFVIILPFSYNRSHQNLWRSCVFLLSLREFSAPVVRSACAGPCHGGLCSLQDVGAFSPINASEFGDDFWETSKCIHLGYLGGHQYFGIIKHEWIE